MNEENNTENQSNGNGMGLMIVIGIFILVAGGVLLFNKPVSKSTSANLVTESTPSLNQMVEGEETNVPVDTESSSSLAIINVEGGMFYFKPNEIRVKKGEKVKILFKNVEGMHDFVIDELNVKTTKIGAGESTEVEFTPDKAGSFEFYCSVGNHRSMGMKGALIVE